MKFGISFDFDAQGDTPSVLIHDDAGFERLEVFEEPILKTEEWSWDDDDWEAGPIAKQLVTFMNSDAFHD